MFISELVSFYSLLENRQPLILDPTSHIPYLTQNRHVIGRFLCKDVPQSSLVKWWLHSSIYGTRALVHSSWCGMRCRGLWQMILVSSMMFNPESLHTSPQVDTFLRDNLDWMSRASHWAKFTATASIGVVHRGHMKESMNLLHPYLPQGGVSAHPYSEGGALYALGLIHSNKGSDGNAAVSPRVTPLRAMD